MSQSGSRPMRAPHTSTCSRTAWTHSATILACSLILLLSHSSLLPAQPSTPTASPAPFAKTVRLRVDGTERVVQTAKETVRTLLHQEGVTLRQLDRIDPPADSPLADGAVVTIVRVERVAYTMKVAVEPETITRGDATQAAVTAVVVQSGRTGKVEEQWVAWKKDGEVTVRELRSRRVLVEALPRVVEYRAMNSRRAITRTMTVVATAYHPYDPGCNGRTATGVRARKGIIAVDPRVIPLGTRVYVEGYGEAIAADTGGAIKGSKIDVCFESHTQVRNWGRRTVTVTILG